MQERWWLNSYKQGVPHTINYPLKSLSQLFDDCMEKYPGNIAIVFQLAAFKAPRIIEFRDGLPKTAVGKILRRQLVEEEKAKLA